MLSLTLIDTILYQCTSLSGDWLAVEWWLPSFALLDYWVTNQIYLSITRKTSRDKLSQSECLIRHCLISEFGAACIPSYIYIYKSDLSLCNQAVQNSVITILPRVSPLTVVHEVFCANILVDHTNSTSELSNETTTKSAIIDWNVQLIIDNFGFLFI